VALHDKSFHVVVSVVLQTGQIMNEGAPHVIAHILSTFLPVKSRILVLCQANVSAAFLRDVVFVLIELVSHAAQNWFHDHWIRKIYVYSGTVKPSVGVR
jgi:hypothetical protein